MANEEKTTEKKTSTKKATPEREIVRVSKDQAETAAKTAKKTTEKVAGTKTAKAKEAVREIEKKETAPKTEAIEKKEAPVQPVAQGEKGKSSIPWRVGAFISWAVGIAAMVLAVIMIMEGNERLMFVGIGVAALACIVGALLWKKANRISPCKVKQDGSVKSKILTFLYNQMGVVFTFITFLPIGLVLFLRSDKLTAKGKRWASIITAVLVLTVGAAAYDYNAPVAEVEQHVSVEQLEEKAEAGDIDIPDNLTGALTDDAYWTRYGYAYHFDSECRAIVRSLTIYAGTLADAVEAKKVTPCSFCAGGGQ